MLVWFGVTASSSRFTIIHIIYPLFFLGGGGVSCTVRHDRCGASHCSRRSCGVIDTSFRSSCSRFSVSWTQRSSLDSALFPAFFFLAFRVDLCLFMGGGVRHPRPVRESSCPTWSFLPVAWFLPDWRFPFLRLRLRSSSPWPPFILSIGRDVSGSAEPALVLYALGTEHLPRCSHMDAILRFVR